MIRYTTKIEKYFARTSSYVHMGQIVKITVSKNWPDKSGVWHCRQKQYDNPTSASITRLYDLLDRLYKNGE